MNNIASYQQLRDYSDKSIPYAKKYIMQFLYSKIEPTEEWDDITNSTDLILDIPKVRFAHRSRKKTGNIIDVTIKTGSWHGKERYNGDKIYTEFDKLCAFKTNPRLNFYYFYCFYDDAAGQITRYVIYDLKRIIEMPEFANRKLFMYATDLKNRVDKGSQFNCISLDVLRHYECLLVDFSNRQPDCV